MAMWRTRTILGVASLAATGLIALALFAIGGGASGTSASGATAKGAKARTGPPTPAERQARQQELAQERIDAAVKSGELTPQQAARIKSCMNGGSCPRPHWVRGGPRRFRGGPRMGFRFGPPPMGGPPPGDMGPP